MEYKEQKTSKRKIAHAMAIQTQNNIIRGSICYTLQLEKFGVTRNYEKELHKKKNECGKGGGGEQ
jgi:hypothetical protein